MSDNETNLGEAAATDTATEEQESEAEGLDPATFTQEDGTPDPQHNALQAALQAAGLSASATQAIMDVAKNMAEAGASGEDIAEVVRNQISAKLLGEDAVEENSDSSENTLQEALLAAGLTEEAAQAIVAVAGELVPIDEDTNIEELNKRTEALGIEILGSAEELKALRKQAFRLIGSKEFKAQSGYDGPQVLNWLYRRGIINDPIVLKTFAALGATQAAISKNAGAKVTKVTHNSVKANGDGKTSKGNINIMNNKEMSNLMVYGPYDPRVQQWWDTKRRKEIMNEHK
jgi:hypothetical protein